MLLMPEIRMATPLDAEGMLEIYRPLVENSVISFEFTPPDVDAFSSRIEQVLTRFPWLVCQWQDTIAGYAYGGPHRSRKAYQWSVEWSVYVHRNFYRRGIARALYQSLEAISEYQGFRNALAGITLPNPASVAFHESFGFTQVGVYHHVGYKHDSWRSVGWWEKRIGEEEDPPADPISIDQAASQKDLTKYLNRGLASIKKDRNNQW